MDRASSFGPPIKMRIYKSIVVGAPCPLTLSYEAEMGGAGQDRRRSEVRTLGIEREWLMTFSEPG